MKLTERLKQAAKKLKEVFTAKPPEIRFAEEATQASLRRQRRHSKIQAQRRNTRGLPLGISRRQDTAAHATRVSYPTRTVRIGFDHIEIPRSTTRQAEIITTLDRLERNHAARAKSPRPSKFARRVLTSR
jgi:hypothetical protein